MDNMRIPSELRARLKRVCAQRSQGLYGDDEIAKNLIKFVKGELEQKFKDLDLKDKIGEKEFSKIQRVYNQYKSMRSIDGNAVRRVFDETGQSRNKYPYLDELIYLYLDEFDPVPLTSYTDDESLFSQGTVVFVRDRVCNFCSYPCCKSITVLGDPADKSKIIYFGKACAIYGLKPNNPRYSPDVKVKEDDVENAIWLCIRHSKMVTESSKFSADELIRWKTSREKILWDAAEGGKGASLSFNPNDNQSKTAIEILDFFNNLQPLYASVEKALSDAQIACVITIGDYLMNLIKNAGVRPGTILQAKIFYIDAGCDAFNEISEDTHDAALLAYSFAALKLAIGAALADTAAFYEITIPENISTITPIHPK